MTRQTRQADDSARRITELVKSTHDPRVIDTPLRRRRVFALDYDGKLFAKNYKRPVMVSSTGEAPGEVWDASPLTAGRLAAVHATNAVACLGGEPLFAEYNVRAPRRDVEDLVRGMVESCRRADCALLDGTVAESDGPCQAMVTCFGIAEGARLFATRTASAGDAVIGIEGAGLQAVWTTNRAAAQRLRRHAETLGLAEPPHSYCRVTGKVRSYYKVKKVVTGVAACVDGGLVATLATLIPGRLGLALSARAAERPLWKHVSEVLRAGRIEAARLANVGFGMVISVAPYYAGHVADMFRRSGETPVLLGHLRRSGRLMFR